MTDKKRLIQMNNAYKNSLKNSGVIFFLLGVKVPSTSKINFFNLLMSFLSYLYYTSVPESSHPYLYKKEL